MVLGLYSKERKNLIARYLLKIQVCNKRDLFLGPILIQKKFLWEPWIWVKLVVLETFQTYFFPKQDPSSWVIGTLGFSDFQDFQIFPQKQNNKNKNKNKTK